MGSDLQEMNVQFDTGSYFLVVPDTSLAHDFINTFNCGFSETCHANFEDHIAITYGSSKASGYIIQDQITLGNNLTMVPEVVVLATNWPRKANSTIDGIFGLGYERHPENFMNSQGLGGMGPSSYNFVTDLKNQGLIDKSQFAFYLNNNCNGPNEPTAEFMIGGYDPKYAKGDMTFLNVVANNQWAVELNAISVGSERISITSGNGVALLDSGTSVITFPQAIYQYVVSYIKANTNCKQLQGLVCKCEEGQQPCDLKPSDFPQIEFEFDGMKAVLGGEAYTKMTDNGVFLELMSFDISSEIIILGDTFMRQYLTLFDLEGGKIGLAPSIDFTAPTLTEAIDI